MDTFQPPKLTFATEVESLRHENEVLKLRLSAYCAAHKNFESVVSEKLSLERRVQALIREVFDLEERNREDQPQIVKGLREQLWGRKLEVENLRGQLSAVSAAREESESRVKSLNAKVGRLERKVGTLEGMYEKVARAKKTPLPLLPRDAFRHVESDSLPIVTESREDLEYVQALLNAEPQNEWSI